MHSGPWIFLVVYVVQLLQELHYQFFEVIPITNSPL